MTGALVGTTKPRARMKRTIPLLSVRMGPMLALGLWLSAPGLEVQAQSLEATPLPLWDSSALSEPIRIAPAPVSRVRRIPLFRIAPGFLSDPISMQDDDNGLPGMPGGTSSLAPAASEEGPDWIQFGMGTDNPYLDLRRPGDPGGFGFYRVNTQVQLLDSPTTACTLGFQTVTPAGIQFGGMPDGATVVSPAFSIFHAVGERTAIQGFVTKNVPLYNADGVSLQRNLQYGLAVQRPVVATGPEGLRNLFFSIGALGQVHLNQDNFTVLPTWSVLPGLQWHVNDNWWVSSGVLVPVGTIHTAPGQWQLTCSFRF